MNSVLKVVRLMSAYMLLLVTASYASPTHENSDVEGFPALKILPANSNQIIVVARESRLGSNITYSSGYLTPTAQFIRPPFFSFTLYGYYSQPQWKDIQTVNFKFGAHTYSAKPRYTVQGPNRARSNEAQKSDYLESMIVKVPADVARGIVANNGMVITTTPTIFDAPVSASQLNRFKQLVSSVEALSTRQAAKKKEKSASATRATPTARPRGPHSRG